MKWRAGIVMASVAAAAFFYFTQEPDPLWNGLRVSSWASDLFSTDEGTQARAAATLKEIGAPAAPQLGKLLRHHEPDLPPAVLAVLQRIPFCKQNAGDWDRRRIVVTALLEEMGTNAAPALPDVIRVLETRSETVAQDTQHLLRRIGPAAGHALARASAKGPEVIRVRAVSALRDFAITEEIDAALTRSLEDKSEFVRATAAESMGALKLERAGELQRHLSDRSAHVRAASCAALGELNSSLAHADLAQCLQDSSPAVQLEAAKALWNLNRNANEVLPAFEQLLTTAESWRAAYALAQMREAGGPAVPALIRAMRREVAPRPFRAPPSVTFALGHIGAPAIPALIETLRDKNPLLRLNAAMALGIMEERARPAASALLDAVNDRDVDVRQAVALALGGIGSNEPRAINSLAECLHAEDIFVRSTAMSYLRKVAPNIEWAGSTD